MLALGDSQVVTGVSILVSGYVQLACGLQYYHWLIVVDFAFSSSVTHLTTLTCSRSYLQKRPAIRIWRLVCMSVTAVLLAVVFGSTGYYDNIYRLPAQFFLTRNFASLEGSPEEWYWGSYRYNSLYTVIALCFLSFNYLSRVVQLIPSIQPNMRYFFRSRPSKVIKRWLLSAIDHAATSFRKSTRNLWLLVHMLLLPLYSLSEAVADLYGTLLWEVCLKQASSPGRPSLTTLRITWLTLALVWGTIVVFCDLSHKSSRGLSSTE